MQEARAETTLGRAAPNPAVTLAPVVRPISFADVKAALAKGCDDFLAMPRHTPFLALIYAVVCLLAVRFAFNASLLPFAFPLIGGFVLLGPLAAVGLYDLSRRREQGMDTSLRNVLALGGSPSAGKILFLGLVLLAVFVLWLLAAGVIYRVTLGDPPTGLGDLATRVFTTPGGWVLIVVGNAVGFLFALAVFAISVVSFPMLVDRPVPVGMAVGTSIDAVRASPAPMLAWAAIVVALLALGALPAFVGLAVVLPVLGHATWHLYRRVVEN